MKIKTMKEGENRSCSVKTAGDLQVKKMSAFKTGIKLGKKCIYLDVLVKNKCFQQCSNYFSMKQIPSFKCYTTSYI